MVPTFLGKMFENLNNENIERKKEQLSLYKQFYFKNVMLMARWYYKLPTLTLSNFILINKKKIVILKLLQLSSCLNLHFFRTFEIIIIIKNNYVHQYYH